MGYSTYQPCDKCGTTEDLSEMTVLCERCNPINQKMLAMLKEIEFCCEINDEIHICPVCRSWPPKTHHRVCKLDTLIKECEQ